MITENSRIEKISLQEQLLQELLLRLRPSFVASWFKRILGIKRYDIETSFGHFYIDPVSHFARELLALEGYEPEMRKTLKYYLKPSSTFVDIGANEGFFSILASNLIGPSGKVVAVEPQSRLQAVTHRNFELNHCSNVSLVQYAVSDKECDAELSLSPDTNTGSTSLNQSTHYHLPMEVIPTIKLSTLFDNSGIDTADLVKMDIEGFEYEAVLGSPELFVTHRIKAFALELHPTALKKRGLDPQDITDFLENCGYALTKELTNSVWVVDAA